MVRPLRTFGRTGCPNCLLFADCGGHHLPLIYRIGCASFATSVLKETDDMNPEFDERFWKLWDDTDALVQRVITPLRQMETSGLPRYIPILQNWHLRPVQSLSIDFAVI